MFSIYVPLVPLFVGYTEVVQEVLTDLPNVASLQYLFWL